MRIATLLVGTILLILSILLMRKLRLEQLPDLQVTQLEHKRKMFFVQMQLFPQEFGCLQWVK